MKLHQLQKSLEQHADSGRFAKILELASRVLPSADLDVDVEYDCCVVSQYPLANAKAKGRYVNLTLQRGRTQCRERERHKGQKC